VTAVARGLRSRLPVEREEARRGRSTGRLCGRLVHDPDREGREHEERDAAAEHQGRDQTAGRVELDDREGAANPDAHPVDREREG
jgi:hypothetical protein